MDPQRNEDRQQVVLKSVLEKKHSSGDLQSRLKTRKILGVGETDNGDIHRSKISQVLGHNDHLYVKFPRCYFVWHFIIATVFTGSGIMNIMMLGVNDEVHAMTEEKPGIQEYASLANKLYGSSLLGFAGLMWTLWRRADKGLARTLMAATAVSELLQFGALFGHSWHNGTWDTTMKLCIAVHLVSAVGSGYFFWAIGSSTAGLRKTPSYKDLTEQTQDEPTGADHDEPHTPRSTSMPDAKKKD